MGVWHGMKCRCYTKSSNGYARYGNNGVRIGDEWLHNFKAFYDWCMANGWRKGLQIDKDIKAKELGLTPNLYSPERCSIVTPKRNGNSKKSNRILEFDGKKLTISQWADETRIPRNAIRMRIEVHGFTIEQALTLPLNTIVNKAKYFTIEYDSLALTVPGWAKKLNASSTHIYRLLHNGLPFSEIYKRYTENLKNK